MSYNIMSKNASFKGDISGTIENQVNDWDNQSIGGNKTFTAAITSSADVMLSGSGKVSASFFYGDATHLTNAGTITSYSNHATNRLIAGGASSTAIKGLSTVTFADGKLGVTGQISASLGVSGSEFHGDGSNLTAVTASFVTASNVVGVFDAAKIATGTFADARIPNLDTAKITTGTFADARISEASVTQHQAALDIAGGQLTGNQSIANARLQDTVSVVNVTASGHMSASTFHGDGTALTGVTATPTPAGSNTQIQFNNNGAIAADADLTFLTGSNTLATSNVSASVNISGSSLYLQDEIIVGGQTFVNSEGNVTAGNGSFIEITASSTISSSADVYGANFRGNGSTLNNVPLGSSNAASIVFVDNSTNKTITTNSAFTFNGTDAINTGGGFKGTTLSASADLQVGGHITGSGDVVLGGTMYWDRTGTGDTTGPKLTPGGSPANSLNIDGDSIITIQADTNARFRVGTASTPDLILDITPTVVSSSVPITGSVLHTNGGITMPGGGGGDFTFLSDQGNVTAGSIEMIAGGSDVLNFNDNSISGSGNISGSAFYGDGSNLENVQASPSHRYAYFTNNSNLSTVAKFVDWLGPSNQANLKDMRGGIIIAPTSGSIVRVSFTPTDDANTRSDGDEMILGVTRNAVNTLSVAQAQGKQLIGATGSFNKSISYYDDNNGTTNTFTGEIDFVNGNNVTGSNSFDPGDILGFAFRTPGVNTNLVGITLVLKFEEP